MVEKDEPFTRGIPRDNWTDWANQFNSMKYLMWREKIESIVEGNFQPPYMVDLDPSNICNYDKCIWCNSKVFRHRHPRMLSTEHLLNLADFFKEWGVKSSCVSGGGEPLTNPGFSPFIWRMKKNGLKTGIITNGSLLDHEKAVSIAKCSSWCGFSVDAGTEESFAKVHGVAENIFSLVIENIKHLVDLKKRVNSNLEITYKFLLHPLNANEVITAVKLAKEIGCNTFHLRPVCIDNLYGQKQEQIAYTPNMIDKINQQLDEAKDYETDNFKFYGVRHKFNPDFTRKINFKRCLATPMMATFGADGNVHLCFDLRGKPDFVLCSHFPDPREILDVWGSAKHKEMIEKINPEKCPRCTVGTLNEIIEKAFIEDRMYKDFL